MLDQLRSSGSLRYFKNEEFQNLTGELTVAFKNVYDRQDMECEQGLRYIKPLLIQHYDYTFDAAMKVNYKSIFEAVEKYKRYNELFPFHLNGIEKFDKQQAVNVVSFFLASIVTLMKS